MIKLAITFGTMYSRQPHPAHRGIHPYGFVTVEGEDYFTARDQVIQAIGNNFAFDYPYEEFVKPGGNADTYYPLGEIGKIVDGRLVMAGDL